MRLFLPVSLLTGITSYQDEYESNQEQEQRIGMQSSARFVDLRVVAGSGATWRHWMGTASRQVDSTRHVSRAQNFG